MKAFFNCIGTEVQVVVFNLKGFFEVSQGASEFFSATEDACKVVVGHCSVSVTLLSEHFGLTEQLKSHIKVF